MVSITQAWSRSLVLPNRAILAVFDRVGDVLELEWVVAISSTVGVLVDISDPDFPRAINTSSYVPSLPTAPLSACRDALPSAVQPAANPLVHLPVTACDTAPRHGDCRIMDRRDTLSLVKGHGLFES